VATKNPQPQDYPETIQDLVREYALRQAEAAPILARMEEIKKTLRFDLPRGTHKIAGLSIGISPNNRFDAKAFEADYPIIQNHGLYKPMPDMDAIRENLAPAEIRKYTNEGDPRVTVK
jgi:hypothetical protein